MNKIYSSLRNVQTGLMGLKGHLLRGAALLILLCTVLPAQTQDLYIIHNGDNYLSHNASSGAVNTTRVTAFDPTTCFWIISGNYLRPVNSSGEVLGNLYLRPRSSNNNYSLNTNTSTNYRDWNGLSNGGQPNYNYRYLRLNGTTWEVTNNNSNRGTLRLVDVSTVSTTSTNPTISGADVLTATGNSSYNASGAVYQQGGYTDYYFNSAHHYFNGNTSITPATATISGYSWSISSDADVTASGTTATGTITVNTLPESDVPATITVTVTFTGGTPEVAANTTLTGTKEIIIQGTKPSAPTITVNGTSVTLATTATGSTSIRYTLDGTEPTASTGNVYSGAIDLSGSATSPVTIKAVTVRNGNASDVSTEVVTLTLPTPVITANGSAGTATITCGIAGATIYYTTDGSTPTTSSSQYTIGLTGLAVMTTIKAIAVKDGWNNSAIASTTLTIPSGVSDGVVTLFDCEPHSWSYYGDPDCPIRSLSPADVKITYYGDGIVMTGNADYTASSTDTIHPSNANYEGGAKVNVGGENENTFIYYKTLERGDATDAAWTFSSGNQSSAASRCPYTPIPNPFQVRPTYGSRGSTNADDFTGWRGFQCWRLKSVTGGSVYSAASGGSALTVGAVINAETPIYFAPNSEYGMEVELEAVWARAYLKKGNSGNANAILDHGNLGVERNFMTLTANENYRFNGTTGRRITNVDRAVTISCYYPSGEAPEGTNGVIVGNNNNITLGADTKFENVTLSAGSYTLTSSGYNVIVGRGCTSTNVGTVRGMSDGSTSAVNYTIRLESGTFGTFALIDNTAHTYSSTVSTRAIFGSDYDRAKTDNGKLSIAANSTVYGGDAVHVFNSSSNRNNLTYDWLIKSGRIQGSKSITDANADESIYIGNSGNNDNTQYMGKRRFTMEGGEMASLAGSLNSYGNNRNTYMVNDGDAVEIRIKGGTIRGSVYGAAAYASATGNRKFVFTGGEVRGWIAGGANGTQSDGGYMYGSTKIYIGGKTNVNSNSSNSVINRAVGGNVFGAGCGYGASSNSGQVTEGTTVAIADEAYVERGVYGGGSYGYTTQTANVYILGGTVDGKDGGVNGTTYLNTIDGGVYGGACQNQGGTTNIIMSGGTVNGSVYGGSNYTGTLSGTSTVTLNGGTINGSLYGGGNGEGGTTNVTGAVHVTVNGGTVTGAVYGCGNVSGAPQSTVNVDVYGTDDHPGDGTYAIGAVFGGGNQANYNSTPNVTVHGNCTGTEKDISIGEVYGGGNLATVTNTNVAIYGGDTIGAVYAGAKGTLNSTTVMCTSATLNVYGGTIKRVFPGNNFGGYIGTSNNGTVTTTINANTVEGGSTHCPLQIGALFHGGNQASSKFRPVTITCTGAESEGIDTLFGGANQANITSDISLSVDNGNIRHAIFGGNNTSGTVQGDIVLDILKPTTSTASCYSAAKWPTVFGGGFGTATKVTGDVTVNIGKKTDESDAAPTIAGDVYGGSAMGNVNSEANNTSDTTAVNIFNGIVEGNVYGGGLGDKKSLGAGHINANAKVYGNVTVNIGDRTANTSTPTVQGYVFGCNNTNGSPQQNVAVHIYRTAHPTAATERGTYADMDDFNTFLNTAAAHATTSFALQAVYGGGNKADYTPATAGKGTSVYIHNCDNTVKMVYGGGRAADVGVSGGITANTSITVDGGRIDTLFSGGDGHTTSDGLPKSGSNTYLSANIYGNASAAVHGGYYTAVFGASNTSGTISGDKDMVIDKTNACAEKELIGTLFGGSNLANLTGNAELTIECGAGEFNEIYGGCNLADITGNVTLNIIGGTYNNVYGGSKGTNGNAANINGSVTLNLYGGTILNAFGGSNVNGNITDTIFVNVNDTCENCPLYLDNVYGSGNLALYKPSDTTIISPRVNLIKGTVGYLNNVGGHPKFELEHQEGHACVFGGGKGDTTYADHNAGKVTANPKVTLNGAADNNVTILNTVYGGGELASVVGNTAVDIKHGHVGCDERDIEHGNGFVFGGGKGDVHSPALGCVSGNSTVTMSGGYVHNTLFGGGQLGSVGKFTTAAEADAVNDIVVGEPVSCAANTGKTTVSISGGQIGPHDVTMRADLGYVFGAGQGYYTQPNSDYADPSYTSVNLALQNARYGYVDTAVVNISDSAFIVGAVWGGSENGQVLHDCHVNVSGGQIGCGYNWSTQKGLDPYTPAQWANAINAVKRGNIAGIKSAAAAMPECHHWAYASPFLPYDAYIDDDITAGAIDEEDRDASTANPGDGHTFFGNVFGGGSGYYPYRITLPGEPERSYFFPFQGRVRGNTYVNITGGHILTSIYGGCEYGDVVGSSTVTMTGGTLGVPRTVDSILAHPVTCYLFGAGKGDQRTSFNDQANVNKAFVTVSDSAFIFGSVFGGGEDGHVFDSTQVNIGDSAWIGNWGTSYYDGNIFGGGRGFGGTTLNAGSISGNAEVNISGRSHILGNVYGGGRLASVGINISHEGDSEYGKLMDDDGTHGYITVNISGGYIGSPLEFAPAAFSTGTAYAVNDIVAYDNNIWRFKTAHAAGAWNADHVDEIDHTTSGNVFGSSMGRLLKVGESNDLVASNFNHLWPGLAKCRSTEVNISDTAHIYGNVYGGGELGYVMKHSNVTIGETGSPEIGYAIGSLPNRRYTGSVFGGGYGSSNITAHTNDSASITGSVTAAMHAGRVYGNADVQMKGGHVWGNIYGGGEMASVGRRWINIALNGADTNYIPNSTNDTIPYTAGGNNYTSYPLDENVGITTVTVSGGTVGDFTNTTVNTHREPGWVAGKTGGVFGGGKGHPGRVGEDFHFTRMAYVDSTHVTMSGGQVAVIFGGGENGHVRYDATVTMTGGTVGVPLDIKEYAMDKYGYSPVPVYQGNVYGGGRGVDRTSSEHLGAAAGQVYRNTTVIITGGSVTHNVYGGGSLATVGTPKGDTLAWGTGIATVTVCGTATIGDAVAEGRNSGAVYGSGRGVAGTSFAHRAYVNNTYVTIGSDTATRDCHVYGNVFGGGENGHVNRHTHVYIKPHALIGERWSDVDEHDAPHGEFVGNVYGGGRGVDLSSGQISRTAGWVHGSTHVTVSGGHIFHNVFGGGSLANVGDTAVLRGYAQYYDTMTATDGSLYNYELHKHKAYTELAFDTATANGHSYIYVKGGEIGTTGDKNGRVFGGGRGTAGQSNYPFATLPIDGGGFSTTTVSYNATGTPRNYTIYHKTVGGKVVSYRGTRLTELGYVRNDSIWVLGKMRANTSQPYQDSVTVRDYTNHTYVTGAHVVINYPSIGGDSTTVTASRSSYADSLALAASNTAGRSMVHGSVYGGGDNGHVRGKTEVLIKQGRIGTLTGSYNGNVFGGGSGEGRSYDGEFSEDAGRVYGHTSVTIDGGWILHNVYGGGNMAGVGDFDVKLDRDGDTSTVESTSKDDWLNGKGSVIGYTVHDGTCDVTITGGHIGEKFFDIVQNEKVDGKWVVRDGMDSRNAKLGGNVFGSSRGQSLRDSLVRKMAWTNITTVNVKPDNNPVITGSVFGGGENGHVFYTATVNINGGTIGVPNQAASGDIFRGNVYGGGRGIDPIEGSSTFSRTSGLILGNTYVNMTRGTVYRNVFGGGSMATVGTYSYVDDSTQYYRYVNDKVVNKDSIIHLQRPETGKTEVRISGGTVGINGTNNGRVFGAGRGVAGLQGETLLDEHTYVDRTYVTISDSADIRGGVFGSGDNGHVFDSTQVVITGGTIGNGSGGPSDGNVFGSGRGSDTYMDNAVPTLSPNAGRVHGNTYVYIVGGTIHNNIYGGGFLATVHGNTNVTINDTAIVTKEVWDYTGEIPRLEVANSHDTVRSTDQTPHLPLIYGDVFGGSALGALGSETGTTVLNILNGTIGDSRSYKYSTLGCGNIFGGGNGNTEGLLSDVIPSGKRDANVLNTITVNIGHPSQYNTPTKGPKILGNVFGCNNVAGSPKGNVDVNIYSTAHTAGNGFSSGDVYPATLKEQAAETGVLDSLDIVAAGGWATVNAEARFALKGVYGGGNQASYVPADADTNRTRVTVFECEENTIYQVYGGGKGGDQGVVNHAKTEVIIYGGHFHQVFAGGNGDGVGNLGANVDSAKITIHGGIMKNVFGGSNSNGVVSFSSVKFVPGTCDQLVQDIFGGGNEAPGNGEIIVTIPCGTKGLTDVYGGSNQADFTGNVTLNILGGTMERAFGGAKNADIKGNVTVNAFAGHIGELFGGNNAGGYIFGDNTTQGNITVNVDFNNEQCPGEKHIDFVYGGGNNAPYKPDGLTVTTTDNEHTINANSATNNPARVSPVVNIISDYSTVVAENTVYTPIVDSAVFGGGKGSTAVVKANPKVVIGADRVQELDGNLKVVEVNPAVSNLHVTIGTHDNTDGGLQGNVFGGGNAAAVEGNTTVNVRGNRTLIHGNVYGGGNAAAVDGNTNVYIGEKPE